MRSTAVGRILAGSVLLCCTVACPAASGEVGVPDGTGQQVAADALFEQYAPAPATPGIVCLVDSGVDVNPDTSSILAGSYALSAGTNTGDELAALNPALPGGHPDGHGTYMAMVAAAPANGWGMVGIAPTSVRVYDLKVLAAGQTTFQFSEYAIAISRCQALSGSMPITVVNLSLGSSTQPTGKNLETLESYVQSANAHGLGVVAAAGNEAGEAQAPASIPGVLGVGASDVNPANLGALCAFSNRGTAVALLAPGCGTQPGGGGIEIAFSDDGSPAWADGTSESAVIVSAAEASMRAYSPTITYSQAQGCITSTVNRGSLDVAAAFEACGLGQIVNEGMAAYRAANSSATISAGAPQAATLTPASHPDERKPRITRISFQKHRLTITLAGIPKGLRVQLVVQERTRTRLVTLKRITSTHRTITLYVPRWDRITARFLQGAALLPVAVITRVTHTTHPGGSR
jgi:Subtilase family